MKIHFRTFYLLVLLPFFYSCTSQCALTGQKSYGYGGGTTSVVIRQAMVEEKITSILVVEGSDAVQEIPTPSVPEQTDETTVLKEIQELPEDTQETNVFPVAGEDELIEREIRRIMLEFGEDVEKVPEIFLREVKRYIRVFQTNPRYRKFVIASLERSSRYLPLVKAYLKERNIPEDMAYIAFIESGFNPKAVSKAGAVGMWQFMPGTARNYSLRVGKNIDERIDPIKSTFAATEYFNDLIAIFGPRSFLLAMAAYNCGEWKIVSCLKAVDNPFEERNFWHIRSCLAEETREYPPRVIASAIIGNSPEAFGFPRFEGGEDTLSPVLLADYRPGRDKISSSLASGETHLNIAEKKSTRQSFSRKKNKGPKPVIYIVKKGNTLSLIAEAFSVEASDLKRWNNLKNDRILTGQTLKIYPKIAMEQVAYTVKRGDTISELSGSFKIRSRHIILCNGLKNGWNIQAGQKLVFYRPVEKKPLIHVVRKGTNLTCIAGAYNVTVRQLIMWNNLNSTIICPGQKLRIYI